jgi:hypothetical protein
MRRSIKLAAPGFHTPSKNKFEAVKAFHKAQVCVEGFGNRWCPVAVALILPVL